MHDTKTHTNSIRGYQGRTRKHRGTQESQRPGVIPKHKGEHMGNEFETVVLPAILDAIGPEYEPSQETQDKMLQLDLALIWDTPI